MKDRKLPMWQDPDESPAVRRLLRAGRVVQRDYDVERGLARYLANLQASAPAPLVAAEVAHKATLPSLLGWLLPPIVSVVALGGWALLHHDQAPVPVLRPSAGIASLQATEPQPLAAASAPIAAYQPQAPAADTDAFAHAARSDDALANRTQRAVHEPSERNDERVHLRRDEAASRGYAKSAPAGVSASASRQSPLGYRRGGATAVSGASSKAGPASAAVLGGTARSEASETAARSHADEEVAAAQLAAAQNSEPAAPKPEPNVQAENATAARPQPEAIADSDSRLEREMQMLAVAQRILASDPARALRLTRQGEHEFPGTMFSAERKQLGLLALVKLGRLSEARQKGSAFLRAYPNAPWTARLREALNTGRVPTL